KTARPLGPGAAAGVLRRGRLDQQPAAGASILAREKIRASGRPRGRLFRQRTPDAAGAAFRDGHSSRAPHPARRYGGGGGVGDHAGNDRRLVRNALGVINSEGARANGKKNLFTPFPPL